MKPLWFGPEDRPLFGWLHVPENNRARGGVVLCATLGIEAVSANYAYRCLADRLAEEGLVVLRFDYDGTGDSAGGEGDPGRVAAWLDSIRIATDLVRGMSPGRMGVVGMRMGATLVAETFGSGPATVDDLVLWDPCASGRAFLREQGALWSFALGARSNEKGSVETPGLVFYKETATDLSEVTIGKGEGPLADGVLLLMRAGRKGDRRMNERLAMPHVERQEIFGQEELVDVRPDAAIVPEPTVETIVEWLAARAAGTPEIVIDPAAVGRSETRVRTALDGAPLDERVVSLGPRGLFGIITCPKETGGGASTPAVPSANPHRAGEPGPRPTVFFLNAGLIDHVGPGRWWVQLARSWAEAGFRSVRFDLTGIGGSPLRDGQQPGQAAYPPDALDDVLDALRAVVPDDQANAILVGVCSGGYHAAEGALATKIRGLCIVNPILTIKPAEVRSDAPPELQLGKLDARRQASGATRGWARALPAHDLLGVLAQRLPGVAWWLINRIAVQSPPARSLSKLIDAGVNVFVIAGPHEARVITRGEGRIIRRLRRTDDFRLEVIPDLEHSLLEREGREEATALLTEHVLGRYGFAAASVPVSTATSAGTAASAPTR